MAHIETADGGRLTGSTGFILNSHPMLTSWLTNSSDAISRFINGRS